MFAVSQAGFGHLPNAVKDLRSGANLRRARDLIDAVSSRISVNIPVLEAILSRLDGTLSLHRILARVVAVREETHDVTTYVLRPNARFGSYLPGSYIIVHLTLNGLPVQRAYSLSSSPGNDGLIAITVKRVPGGVVSNHLAALLAPGAVLEISPPQGQFVLRAEPRARLLLLSAGSGITPVMSMLRHLVRCRSTADVTFVHFARTPEDIIFGRELAEISARLQSVNVVLSPSRLTARGPA